MKKAEKTPKKKMTIEDLASTIGTLSREMKADFSRQEKRFSKKIEEEVEKLAIMTQDNFNRMEKRFGLVEDRLDGLDSGQKKMSQDILSLGEKYPTRFEFDNLSTRVWNLEHKKSKTK